MEDMRNKYFPYISLIGDIYKNIDSFTGEIYEESIETLT